VLHVADLTRIGLITSVMLGLAGVEYSATPRHVFTLLPFCHNILIIFLFEVIHQRLLILRLFNDAFPAAEVTDENDA
jgi:hypothetical protein